MADATPKAAAAPKHKGVYAVLNTDGTVIIEPSEIRSLRTAVATGGKAKPVEFGEVITPFDARAGEAKAATTAPESY